MTITGCDGEFVIRDVDAVGLFVAAPIEPEPSSRYSVKTEYLGVVHRHQDKIVKDAIQSITEFEKAGNPFEAIAFTGMSGAMIAPVVAYAMGKQLICVRKDESRHSVHKVEGPLATCKYIIIDDFVCSGATLIRIVDGIKSDLNEKDICVGVYCYNSKRRESSVFGHSSDYQLQYINSPGTFELD